MGKEMVQLSRYSWGSTTPRKLGVDDYIPTSTTLAEEYRKAAETPTSDSGRPKQPVGEEAYEVQNDFGQLHRLVHWLYTGHLELPSGWREDDTESDVVCLVAL